MAIYIPPCDQPQSLVTVTQNLIKKDKRTRYDLAKELEIPFHWLNSFAQGYIDAPSVNRVQYIYEKLSGKKLVNAS